MKKIKNKNKYIFFFKEQLSKFMVVFIAFSMLASFSNVNQTYAYFSDSAVVSGNTFTAGTLAVSISNENVSAVVLPGNTTTTTTTLSKTNSTNLDYQYFTSTTILNIDQTACNYITILATSPSRSYPSMSLKNFVSDTSVPNGPTQWDFTFSVGTVLPADLGKVCNFKISYNAWQTNLPNNSQGFSNIAEMTGSIQIGQTVQTIHPGDVVINEIMWMGSSASTADEWIELRNTTGNDIPLNNWKLENSADSHGALTLSGTLLANGYFVISNYDKAGSAINIDVNQVNISMNFYNDYHDNGVVILKDKDANIIDSTPAPITQTSDIWPAGINDTSKKWSMERNTDPAVGWHTCDPLAILSADLPTMKSYWDLDAQNYNCGTPGHPNFSKNDPTSPDYDPTFVSEIIPVESVVPEELLPSASLLEEIPPATEEVVAPAEEQPTEEIVAESVPEEEIVSEEQIIQEESVEEVTVVEPAESVVPEELLPSASLPEEMPQASPEEVVEVVVI